MDVFEEQLKVKKDIHLMMITAAGLAENTYSESLVENTLTLDDFLK